MPRSRVFPIPFARGVSLAADLGARGVCVAFHSEPSLIIKMGNSFQCLVFRVIRGGVVNWKILNVALEKKSKLFINTWIYKVFYVGM